MSKKKYTGSINGKGYYIALVLCAAAIGIAGFLYYRNADEPNPSLQNPDPTLLAPNDDQAVVATNPDGSFVTPTDSTTPTTGRTSLKTVSPVEGQTVAVYAMDSLTYNQTTRDWRVHNGIDIAAEAGTSVCAAADGEVYTVYDDDGMGMTVVIRHDGGYTTRYASLSEDLAVSVGDTVEMGQVIGTVGETAVVETAIGPHVHFTVTYQDIPMDPAEFLKLG